MSKKFDFNKYFEITPDTAYSSPVYIHSHTRSLNKAISKDPAYFKTLQDALTELKSKKKEIHDLLYSTWKVLEDRKQELINLGFPTKNGKPVKLGKRWRELYGAIEDAKKKFAKWQRIGTTTKYDHSHSIQYWLSSKAFQEEVVVPYASGNKKSIINLSSNIVAEFFNNLSRKISKTTNKTVTFSKEEQMRLIEKYSVESLAKYLKKEYSYDITADQIATSLLKLKDFWSIVKIAPTLKQTIPELYKIYDYEVNNLKQSASVKHCLNMLKSGSSYFVKLGSFFEMASEGKIKVTPSSSAGYDTEIKGSLEKKLISHTPGKNKDITTSDIEATFKILDETIKFGMSLKVNSLRFEKTKNKLTEEDMHGLKKLLDIFDEGLFAMSTNDKGQKAHPEFEYYVLNVQALSLVRFGDDYQTYLKAKEEKSVNAETPPTSHKATSLVNITSEVEMLLSQIAFVKAVVGGLFSEKEIEDIEKIKVLPVILSTPKQDYWTADILKYLYNLYNRSDKDSSIIREYVTNYTPYNPYRDEARKEELKSLLIKLYIAKAENAKKVYGNEKVDAEKIEARKDGINRYEELKKDTEVLNLLKEIAKNNLMINKTRMSALKDKNWIIRFDYSDIK